MKENIGTRVPEEIVKDIEYLAGERGVDRSKMLRELLALAVRAKLLDIAFEKYSKKEVSLGRAAELAKLPLTDFMKLASERKEPINYSLESLRSDFNAALKESKSKK